MKLICPNCQKELTVPDEYAGQLMKCPLCAGTFTAPMLPQAVSVSASPALGHQTPVPDLPPEIFKLASEPAAPPPLVTAAPPRRQEPSPSIQQPPPPPPPVVLGVHEHRRSLHFNPKVLQYVPPAAFFLIFVLSFFTWDGRYKGGVAIETQNGWQAAFGTYSINSDLGKDNENILLTKDSKDGPSFGALTFFYGLLMLPTVLLTLGVVLLNFVPLTLPPPVQKLLPWRWAGVTALTLMAFLMLALQTVAGFGLESAAQEKARKLTEAERAEAKTTDAQISADIHEGTRAGELHRTKAFRLVVLLHLTALVCAGMVFCIQQRPTKPVPRIDILW